MYLHQIMLLLSVVASFSSCRGPHHPRGETIIKHHVHYRPSRTEEAHEKLTQDSQLLHDKEHIREDLGEWMQEKAIEDMSDEELEFHYFNLHDFDKNSQLDGLEILQAMRHTSAHAAGESEEEYHVEDPNDFNFFVDLIDEVLLQDDTNADGFISYSEYVAAKKKEIQSKVINDLLNTPKIS